MARSQSEQLLTLREALAQIPRGEPTGDMYPSPPHLVRAIALPPTALSIVVEDPSDKVYSVGGQHMLLELKGCSAALINDVERIRAALSTAAEEAGATVLGDLSHKFNPQGVTVILSLLESHISAHSWPEHGHVSIDLYTCGEKAKPKKAIPSLMEAFKAKECDVMFVSRGKKIAVESELSGVSMAERTQAQVSASVAIRGAFR